MSPASEDFVYVQISKSFGVKIFVILAFTHLIAYELIANSYPTNFHPGEYQDDGDNELQVLDNRFPIQLSREERRKLQVAMAVSLNEKIILDWYPRKNASYDYSSSKVCGRCRFTTDRSLITHKDTAAVVFIFKYVNSSTMPNPEQRRSDQLYVWRSGEAPPSMLYMSETDLKLADKYNFNATFTYRRDSDIYSPYGSMPVVFWRTSQMRRSFKLLFANKSRLAVAVVSNCDKVPGAVIRSEILRNLSKLGLKIDLLGKCFENNIIGKEQHKDFLSLLKDYKFYFSFENSYHCRDYVTEKFYANALEVGAVPVIWGPTREDVELLAPPNSFIHVEDYKTYESLIEYLNYLDRNDSALMEYFRWHSTSLNKMPNYGMQHGFCQLCRIIHGVNVDDLFKPNPPSRALVTDKIARRTVSSLSEWYFGTENEECKQNLTDLRKTLNLN